MLPHKALAHGLVGVLAQPHTPFPGAGAQGRPLELGRERVQAVLWQMAGKRHRPGCRQGWHPHWHPLPPHGETPLSLGMPHTSTLEGTPPILLHLGVLVAARAHLGQDMVEGS